MNHLELQILLLQKVFAIKWNAHPDIKPLKRTVIRADTFGIYGFSKTSTTQH